MAATFDVRYNSEKRKGEVEIIGFAARFKNWHPVEQNDLDWIRATSYSRDASRTEYEKTAPVRK